MPSCPTCGATTADNARFCSSCGRPASSPGVPGTPDVGVLGWSPDDVTIGTVEKAPRSKAALSSHASSVPGGFAPGAVLADRYRIIALLGRGGMGEVYRADDLTLGQPVALKFLPAALENDTGLLDMLHSEVRNARQVSHPNVCRVYDIGEVDGRHFYTMEFIDGEDLSSLLRRIGRLSPDKALEIAHQICAGLAAAHDSGLLHRDLKPANIMLDGRGRARITDFGLALPAELAEGKRELAGTPAYMAPEQLAGGQAGVRSDIYSLGLVLYEIFTGKRPFDADSAVEWRRAHLESQPKTPSSVVGAIDPAIERAILRCLQKDPKLRPASAMQVAAALPGGDPLAAALAAGETPSPEMVAAAGAEAGISPRNALLVFLATIAMLIGWLPLAHRGDVSAIAPMQKTPDALNDRAQEYARHAGYSTATIDQYSWTVPAVNYLRYLSQHEAAPARVRRLPSVRPTPYVFNYLASPEPLVPLGGTGVIDGGNPPLTTPGMLAVTLDGSGELRTLHIVPPRVEPDTPPQAAIAWDTLFADAALDFAKFKPSAPKIVPPFASDARFAWEGERDGVKVRVESASFHGKPVMFFVQYPWTILPGAARTVEQVRSENAATVFQIFLILLVPVTCGFVARRNIRTGRGDVSGAWRLAVFVFSGFLLTQLLWNYYPSNTRGMFFIFLDDIGIGLLFGTLAWVAYVAVEPMVRRVAPHMMVSWTRVLAGRFTDPLVGRDVLLGIALLTAATIISGAENSLAWWFNIAGEMPGMPPRQFLGTTAEATGLVFSGVWQGGLIALLMVFVFTGFRAVLRNRWAAAAVIMLVLGFQDVVGSSNHLVTLLFTLPSVLLIAVMVGFLGPLAAAVGFSVSSILYRAAAVGTGAWYSPRSWAYLLLIIAIAAYGFRCAVAGRPLFSSDETSEPAKAAVSS